MANKLAVSLKDPATGVETNAQEITNAPNGDYIVVRGAQASTDPNGDEWTAEALTAVQHKLVAQTGQNTTTTVRSSGHTIEFWSSPLANNVFMAPSDNMEFSNDPNNVIQNVIGWDYDDSLDQKDQTGWRVRIFPDFVVNSADFDPNTNPYFVWSQSGTDDSNQVTITKADGFISGERYWAYVQVSKEFHNQQWLGDWTAKPFTVIIEQPQPAIISVLTNLDNATNQLLLQSTDNLFSDRNGDFGDAETGQASIGGWNVASIDSAGTTIDVGVTGGPLGGKLSTGQSISVLPFGATGYVSTDEGITATQAVGTTFKVSGTNGSNTSPLGFPLSGQFWILMPDGEKMLVTNEVDGTAKTDPDTFIIVQRGYQGTTPAAHAQWDAIIYGTQDDIYVGSIGTLRWEKKTGGGTVTKTVVAGRPASGGHPQTINYTDSFDVVSMPKGADNSKKKYLWVRDRSDALRAGMVGTFAHATPKATNPTKKAKSVSTEDKITIDFVSGAPTTFPPKILLGTVSANVAGNGSTSVSSLPITLAKAKKIGVINFDAAASFIGPNVPAGQEVTLSYYESYGIDHSTLTCDVTIDKAIKIASGASAHLSFKARNSFGGFNGSAVGSNGGAVFLIPVGTKVYYQPPGTPNYIKKVTLAQPLASYPAAGDKFTVEVSTTYQHVGATKKVAKKTVTTPIPVVTHHYEQDFVVAESVSTDASQTSVMYLGSALGYWDGTVFTAGASAPSFNAIRIFNVGNLNTNDLAGFSVLGLGILSGTTITSNTAVGGNSVAVLVLSQDAIPAYSAVESNTPTTPVYTTDVTLLTPSSTVIPAGSQNIPVEPFVPKAKFPLGTAVKFSYPPYFGAEALIVKAPNGGSSEITIQDANWEGWNSSNACAIVPGTVYGLSAFAKGLVNTDDSAFNLYIDWFDALNNFLATSDGTQSLVNPSINNSITPQFFGPSAGTSDYIPNGIVAVAPKSATIAPIANYYSTIGGGGPLLATGNVGSQTLNLNSVTGVTIVAGDILTIGQGLTAEEVQVIQIVSTVITMSQKLLYNHSSDLVSTGSAYTLTDALTMDLSANTTLVMGSGAVVVTAAAVAAGSLTVPVQFVSGAPIIGADSMGMSAAYACPRIEFVNNFDNAVYAVSAPCFKALTAHDPTSAYTAINSEIPGLLRGVDSVGSQTRGPDSTFLLPEGTPTEGAGTIYVFDPTNDNGTHEVHMGSGDPILDTTLAAKAQAGSSILHVKSPKGLTAGQPIVLNVYASLPSSSQSVVDVTSALYQSGLTATEQNAANAANNQMAANFTNTKGVVNDLTETVIVDAFWDGSSVVTLEQPLKNSYPVGTQICAFVTSIDSTFKNNQVQDTPVAVLNWNRSGYLNTPGTQYYFVVEYSNDFGKTWTTLGGGDNVVPDAHGQASIIDYAVIPNTTTYYRATANYIDKDKAKTLTKGVVSPPSLAPDLDSEFWWISSTSDETVRFAINVQNGVQETQKHPVGVFYPLGASRPYTVAGVVQGRDAVIDVVWTDNAHWEDFIAFLNTGEIMLLLDPVEGERRYIFISDDVKVTHQAAKNPYRTVEITYVEAAPPGFGFLYGGK